MDADLGIRVEASAVDLSKSKTSTPLSPAYQIQWKVETRIQQNTVRCYKSWVQEKNMTGRTRTETDAPSACSAIPATSSIERAMTVATRRSAQIIDPIIGLHLFTPFCWQGYR